MIDIKIKIIVILIYVYILYNNYGYIYITVPTECNDFIIHEESLSLIYTCGKYYFVIFVNFLYK